jgi:hypothetical protein
MVHFADISWAQLILIEMGALFQFIAACAFVRETSAYRHRKSLREAADPEERSSSSLEEATLLQAIRAGPMAPEKHHENPDAGARAADLLKTAKVKFVQSFKFRPEDSQT